MVAAAEQNAHIGTDVLAEDVGSPLVRTGHV